MEPDPYRTAPEQPGPLRSVPALSVRSAAIYGLVPVLLMGACGIAGDSELAAPPLFFGWLLSIAVCLFAGLSGALGSKKVPALAPDGSPAPEPPDRVGLFLLSSWGSFVTLAYAVYAVGNMNLSRGRQLVRRGRQRLPELAEVSPASSWPEAAVNGWLDNARTEVASVAAFSHLANELLAIGAAVELVEGALRAALEEVEHAKACFQLVGAPYAAGSFAAATWPSDRAPTPRRLAASCLRDACVLEHASALVAERLVARGDLPDAVAAVLARIAREEASHAEHGWQILEYLHRRAADEDAAGREGPGHNAVAEILERALADLERKPPAIRGVDDLESYGLASTAMWELAVTDALQDARTRIQALQPARKQDLAQAA